MRGEARDQATAVGLVLVRLFTGYWASRRGSGKSPPAPLAGGVLLRQLDRFAAGIFVVTNYLFAKGWSAAASGLDRTFIVLLLVVLLGDAGQFLGLDGRWWPTGLRRL